MNMADVGLRPDTTQDATEMVRLALQRCRENGESALHFEAGDYHFWPHRAAERYLFVSNNDEGLKHIAFDLVGWKNFTLDGNGARFIFHDLVSPFALDGCENVQLRNFSMDWARPFHSEGRVLRADENSVDLEIGAEFLYKVEGFRFVPQSEAPLNEHLDSLVLGHALEFDPQRRETAFRVHDIWMNRHRAEDLGSGKVRLFSDLAHSVPREGNVLALMDGRRLCSAFVLSECRDISLENITIHHCGGMGVIAQRCENVHLRKVKVTPGGERMVSVTADATHFVNCRGHILVEDCLFENQMDDPMNVHGIYLRVARIISEREIEVEFAHPQQCGVPFCEAGETLGFIDNESLQTYETRVLSEVVRVNRQFLRLKFETPLPAHLREKHAVINLDWIADLTVRNCTTRGNRARGILCTTGGTALLENNRFHHAGAAILVEGDANFWFESGDVRRLTIRGNTFENCMYGLWGRATIDINPRVHPAHRATSSYHRNICIEGNTFRGFDKRLLAAHSVAGLVFRDNIWEETAEYSEFAPEENQPVFAVEDCPEAILEAPPGLS